jgi:large subunit ribosomal protein L25
MQEIKLKCQERKLPSKEPNLTRERGQIPAELYGQSSDNKHLFLDGREFEKLYKQIGESSLISLMIGSDEAINVLIHEIQKDPITERILHVDFYKVNMAKEIQTHIPLLFVGESEAVKYLSGTLVKSLEELEIACLPGDLISKIEVDISQLKTFDDVIRVADLKLPGNIKVLVDLDRTVASVVPVQVAEEKPVAVEETAEAEAGAGGEAKEGEEVKKTEDKEGGKEKK